MLGMLGPLIRPLAAPLRAVADVLDPTPPTTSTSVYLDGHEINDLIKTEIEKNNRALRRALARG